MKLSDFDYKLPKKLIATHPAVPREAARMLVLNRENCQLSDSHFYDLPKFLKKGDVLVLNESKVIPARLFGTSLGRDFEVLLVKNIFGSTWETWVKPGKKAKIGETFVFTDKLNAKLVKRENEIFVFKFNLTGKDFYEELKKIGEMPIPPYILKARSALSSLAANQGSPSFSFEGDPCLSGRQARVRSSSLSDEVSLTSESNDKDDKTEDERDYQTVFGKREGSVAAPTAGLHFSEELIARLKEMGVQIEMVTLHVSLGTFQPVNTENVEDFKIHSEYFEISEQTADRLNGAKKEGRRIIAVGTTAVRVLESAVDDYSSSERSESRSLRETSSRQARTINPQSGQTSIYIYPGYKFKFVDGIITNFHIPKSSLMLLVSAFSSKECILKAYEHAIEENYKFYSFGDGMLIL